MLDSWGVEGKPQIVLKGALLLQIAFPSQTTCVVAISLCLASMSMAAPSPTIFQSLMDGIS